MFLYFSCYSIGKVAPVLPGGHGLQSMGSNCVNSLLQLVRLRTVDPCELLCYVIFLLQILENLNVVVMLDKIPEIRAGARVKTGGRVSCCLLGESCCSLFAPCS
ncbi:hypothetical protein RDI58_013634 [Solanum bulbocastanum]|uniref:Uncharacterized protein n=1 Tax=Solanum bulbocastanum TaxID=147425 RepID=A0AAN8YE57_SOLBU